MVALASFRYVRRFFSPKFSSSIIRKLKYSSQQTHFGFSDVTEEEKSKKVHGVFENVAENYDLMNDVMSIGIHRMWKDHFISILNPKPGLKILDVAGGTGDISFRIADFINHQLKNYTDDAFLISNESIPNTPEKDPTHIHSRSQPFKIVVCDISQSMLDVGKARSQRLDHNSRNCMEWVLGNAQELPFPENSFDAYTIAFGIRNVVDVEKALEEAYRVLKPGGRFLCLEFSAVSNSALRKLYDLYSFNVIPVMGQVIAADWKSYQYLVESIRMFPSQQDFKKLIENAGFRRVTYENMSFGVVAIHTGFKI